jgi:hypothetical protein
MEITRKDSLELADTLIENMTTEQHAYWIQFKGQSIPYDKAIQVLKGFIENPAQITVKTPSFKKK